MKEESGLDIILGQPVGRISYDLSDGRRKEVRFWIATVAEPDARTVAESDARTVAESDARTVAESDAHTVAESDAHTVAEPDARTVAEPDDESLSQTPHSDSMRTRSDAPARPIASSSSA